VTIEWRPAEGADRPLLQRFECTSPAPRRPGRRPAAHPKPYEKGVQSAIRTLSVPVGGRDGTCLVGFDDGTLVAVALWCRMDDVDFPIIKLRLLAVARTARGKGGAVARECLDEVLARIAAELTEGEVATVYGLVDYRNTASQRLLTDMQFELQADAPTEDPNLTMWAIDIAVDARKQALASTEPSPDFR